MEQDVKIGILSDIHAEPKALRRVLADMPSVDRVLCAGDAVSEYQFCAETVQLLQQVHAQCIQGNHEMVLFSGRNAAYLKKCQAEFAPALLDVLATAPVSLELEVAGARLLMVHASPIHQVVLEPLPIRPCPGDCVFQLGIADNAPFLSVDQEHA